MDDRSFDTLTRRASLMTLGATGLALAHPVAANARKKNIKKKEDVNKRCKQQARAWSAFVTVDCGADSECVAAFSACSLPLESCNFSGFLTCFIAAQT